MDRNTLRDSIRLFLQEDIGRGDLTSESIFSVADMGRASLVARQPFLVAGAEDVAAEVFRVQNSGIQIENGIKDGILVKSGDVVLTIAGPVIDMLKAERIALNLLQRLCGIATLTRKFVDKVKGYPVRITDTRKTTPGLRMLEKYAVQVGGGYNHRFNLTDGVLIKDNHIAACGSIKDAVDRVRGKIPHTIKVEVETDTLTQVHKCLECDVDIIMLDNMDLAAMTEAVKIIGGRALVEASGGVVLETVENIAKTGVDVISIGALTHSASACDIGMDWVL
jgi:nicotinate-nucleotide pyrophosphorylase (carboxylating)